MKVTVKVTIEKPVDLVWAYYTTPEDIVRWNFASDDWHTPSARVDLRVGGSFSSRMEAKDGSAGFDFEGIYTRVIENELLEYEFGDRHALVTFIPSAGSTTVEVLFETEDENSVELQRGGWQAILVNFKEFAESK